MSLARRGSVKSLLSCSRPATVPPAALTWSAIESLSPLDAPGAPSSTTGVLARLAPAILAPKVWASRSASAERARSTWFCAARALSFFFRSLTCERRSPTTAPLSALVPTTTPSAMPRKTAMIETRWYRNEITTAGP